jgi:ribose transport system substrate-binding protein
MRLLTHFSRQIPRAAGLITTVACALALSSCKDNSASGGANPSGGGPPTTSAGIAGPNSAGGPGSAGTSNASTAFDKPIKPEGDVKLAIITNGVSPFWDSMRKGLNDEKPSLPGCDANWLAPERADNNAQKQAMQQQLTAGVSGIAVSPIQADAFAPVIDDAIAKGVPVITFDSDSEKSKRLAYIGTNNFEAGKKAGEAAVALFPNGGKIVAFVGNMSAQNARDRFDGFKKGVEGHNIVVLGDKPFEDDKDAGKARRNVADAITKYPDINGFLGLYSYNGPAIVDEVVKSNLRSKVKIICFDGEPKTLKNLAAGLVDVTVVQKPYEFGRLTTQLLYLTNRKGFKAALEEMKPDLEKNGMNVNGNIIDTGVDVITPANSAEFLKKLKDKGLEST